MVTTSEKGLSNTDSEAENKHCAAQQKWAALIEDTQVAAPQRRVPVSVLKAQGNVPPGNVLVRDRNSDRDEILDDNATVDLAEGNVFYTLPACEAKWSPSCESSPKLAYFVDDRPETTVNPHQTGKTLREWFGFTLDVNLFRGIESLP